MTPQLRELMLRVIDGDPRVLPYMFDLNQTRHVGRVLGMALARGLTGYRFIEWTKTPEGVSILSAAYSEALPEKLNAAVVNKMERAAVQGHKLRRIK